MKRRSLGLNRTCASECWFGCWLAVSSGAEERRGLLLFLDFDDLHVNLLSWLCGFGTARTKLDRVRRRYPPHWHEIGIRPCSLSGIRIPDKPEGQSVVRFYSPSLCADLLEEVPPLGKLRLRPWGRDTYSHLRKR